MSGSPPRHAWATSSLASFEGDGRVAVAKQLRVHPQSFAIAVQTPRVRPTIVEALAELSELWLPQHVWSNGMGVSEVARRS
mmetsp:Transcript_163521/g.524300  ORF Transcript_163521/g.524300 Transcript_163521/m.524300 type:complete len:81 (-) Transcript_163521:253-495(-)